MKQTKEKELFDLVKKIGSWDEGNLHIIPNANSIHEAYTVYQRRGYCFDIIYSPDEEGVWDYWIWPKWGIKMDGEEASIQKAIDLVKNEKFLEQDLQGDVIDRMTGLKIEFLTMDLFGKITDKRTGKRPKKSHKNPHSRGKTKRK